MASRQQRQRREQIARIHTRTEINRRLHRAHDLAFFLRIDILATPCDSQLLWLPSVLDYIADDIGDVQKLLNRTTHSA